MTIKPLNIPQVLREHGLKPNKALGQNFLIDPNALSKVINAANISPVDEVLEIGAGLGSLTRLLAIKAKSVTAVEIDKYLLSILRELLSDLNNVKLVEGDIMSLAPDNLISQSDYIVVANIPYYITSGLIRHLLESQRKPQKIILTVQREVAERVCAKNAKMSLLSLSVQIYGRPEVVAQIPAGCFYPVPSIDSSVLRINLFSESVIPNQLVDDFFLLAHAGFSQKRKTLRNSLSSKILLKPLQVENLLNESGIDPQRRPETLTINEWYVLTENYQNKKGEL